MVIVGDLCSGLRTTNNGHHMIPPPLEKFAILIKYGILKALNNILNCGRNIHESIR